MKTKFIRTNGSGYKIGLSVAHPSSAPRDLLGFKHHILDKFRLGRR